jgi:hypothetical protein
MIYTFMQTTHRRDASTTMESIEGSDIGANYSIFEDPNDWTFPADYPKLQAWWAEAMRSAAEAAIALGCELMLRLEDDILVNDHIIHNVERWDAVNEQKFGLGTLFYPDYWDQAKYIFKQTSRGNTYRNTPDVEGAQGQVFRPELLLKFLPDVQQARDSRGLGKPCFPPSFDWGLSRAAHMHGLQTFVHTPALVDIHQQSLHSCLTVDPAPQSAVGHYWGAKNFDRGFKSSENLSASAA